MRQCTKRPMGGGVGVATHHRHARQGGTIFRTDHMHDALALGHEGEERGRTEFADVVVQGGDLRFADGVGDAVIAQLPAGGGGVVVGSRDDRAGSPNLAFGHTYALESLRAGHFMHQMAVDVQNGGAVFFGVDDVFVPNLVVKRASHAGS